MAEGKPLGRNIKKAAIPFMKRNRSFSARAVTVSGKVDGVLKIWR